MNTYNYIFCRILNTRSSKGACPYAHAISGIPGLTVTKTRRQSCKMYLFLKWKESEASELIFSISWVVTLPAQDSENDDIYHKDRSLSVD